MSSANAEHSPLPPDDSSGQPNTGESTPTETASTEPAEDESPGFVFKDGGFLYTELYERAPVLEDAWRRFGDYDKNAGNAQKAFIHQRKWIAGLGVASTTIAVLFLVLEVTFDHKTQTIVQAIEAAINGQSVSALGWVMASLNLIVVILPILVTILVAASIKFNMGVNWIMLRSSAETLKKEIYRYRTRVDIYAVDRPESRSVVLARRIKNIGKRVMETQVNQSGLEIYRGELPPPYGAARSRGDDGFSNLTPDQYLTYRLEDQFDYYRSKAKRLSRELTQLQWLVYILGGLGTFLAAIGLEVWVAVSSSLAAAFAGFLEFKRVETNLISCNVAASDLYDIRAWWRSLPQRARKQQSNIEALVNSTEQVIQGENASWVQEMRDALAELYGDQDKEAVEELEGHASHGTQIDVRNPDVVNTVVSVPAATNEPQPVEAAATSDTTDEASEEPTDETSDVETAESEATESEGDRVEA